MLTTTILLLIKSELPSCWLFYLYDDLNSLTFHVKNSNYYIEARCIDTGIKLTLEGGLHIGGEFAFIDYCDHDPIATAITAIIDTAKIIGWYPNAYQPRE